MGFVPRVRQIPLIRLKRKNADMLLAFLSACVGPECDLKREGDKLLFQLLSHRGEGVDFEGAGNIVPCQILDDRPREHLIFSGGPVALRHELPRDFAVGNLDGPGKFLTGRVCDPDQSGYESPVEGFLEMKHERFTGSSGGWNDAPGLRVGRGVVRLGYLERFPEISDE